MGAKQSKRSVDISGKEAESAGEVAAAGAGGEGRVEQLADADALKPQLNGDAHIHEQTEKEKELDSGTPENEKDATTEKEAKQEDETNAPVTNGETEQKAENCDTTPVSEDGKKPKKEKVKKKWSLRSISFSRKDKPKQEKKQKEEESKTNGEPEKVPEETAEIPPESSAVEATEDIKTEIEPKEEKTPETPVTEPITNGSFTPESVKADTPVTLVTEEPVDTNPEIDRPEAKIETEPEQLPVNGLTLEEPAKENIEVQKVEESKPEEPKTETTEIALDIPVKKEVCVDQMPLIEPTPPPLPANPPPSSVASFAATTMAPELTDASLANTADTAISSLSADINIKDNINDILLNPRNVPSTETVTIQLPPPVRESSEDSSVSVIKNEQGSKQINSELENSVTEEVLSSEHEIQDTKFEDEVDKIIIDNIDIKNDIESAVTPVLPEVIEIAQKTYELPIATEDNKIAAVSENSKVQVSDITEVSVSKMLVPEISKVQVPEVPVSETPEVPIRDIEMPIPAIQEVLVPQISEIPVPDVPKVPEPEILETPDISELPIHKIPDVAVSKFHEVPVLEIPVVQVPEIPEVPVPAIPESRATDVTELPVPELLNVSDNKSNIQLVHMPIAPVEDLEYIPTVLDVEGELPSPPPPICDDTDNVSILSNEINEKVDNVQEVIHDLKETMINSNHILETEEIVVSFDKENNDNKQTLQNKVQESYGDQIQTTECNGNIVCENMVSTEESTHNETPDDKASKENLNEENGRTVPPVECASVPNAEAGDSLAPSRAAPLATAQEPLPAIDKTITEMIPEVPVVPEINTETETTTDVAVAN